MHAHFLCDKHQTLLLEFVVEYFSSRKQSSRNMDRQLIAIQESIDILSPRIEIVSNDCIQLRSEHNGIKTTGERVLSQVNETTKISDDNIEKINKHIQSQNDTVKELDDAKKSCSLIKMILLETDGTMIFSFNKHHDDINSPFSIVSPIFKTAIFGYSFILRVCSTIDPENDNQGYLSIFTSLLRGDYDQILLFPFPYNISLCLCDQSGQGKHIISTIKPDPKSPSFARPASEKNDEIGVVKFCPLNYLKDTGSIYLKDSVFFVRIFMDFMNTGSLPFG